MNERYVFPAFFCYYDSGKIGVVFEDLPGCVSQGENEADAVRMAQEALELHLWGMVEDGEEIPLPTKPQMLRPQHDQTIVLIEALVHEEKAQAA